jgi:hypothetical protein
LGIVIALFAVTSGLTLAWSSSDETRTPVSATGLVTGVASGSVLSGLIPSERRTEWNPGLNAVGGIPVRTTIFKTLVPSGGDDTSAIQKALDGCPPGQVVHLGDGTFQIQGEGLSITRSNVVLRGNGPGKTFLRKRAGTSYPVVIIGLRWYKYTAPVALAADAHKGDRSFTLVNNPGITAGQLLVIDQKTNPQLTWWSHRSPPGDPSRGWFGEYDRPIGQVVEVKKVSGKTITLTTELHIDFLTSFNAHVVRYSGSPKGPPAATVSYSGLEDLHVANGEGGDGGGNIHLFAAAYSWVKNVESDASLGASVNFDGTFRCVLRDSYLHSTKNPTPGGDGYGVVVNQYAADNLVENNMVWNFNKVMICRTSGGGNVFGYNYMEDGWGAGYPTIPEVGLNASHMTTPFMELFEGNESWNFGTDSVWGNSIYITIFRNHLTGKRRSLPPLALTDVVSRMVAQVGQNHWWYTFMGNVLGYPGMSPAPSRAFAYESRAAQCGTNDPVPMWKLGCDTKPQDPIVAATTIRHGNFDFFTNAVKFEANISQHDLPPSLYLKQKPGFFGSNPWPWVTPETPSSPLATLPARVRFDGRP